MAEKEQQVISRERVVNHGEVLTARREVDAMLDLVKQETERIDSRFLEPACGTGNFLVAILERKLAVLEKRLALRESKLKKAEKKYPWKAAFYEPDSLLALACIYGIDILPDSVQAAKERLLGIFIDRYCAIVGLEPGKEYLGAARLILDKNILVGDALNGVDRIIFTNWSLIGRQFKREEYRFSEIQQESEESDSLFASPQKSDTGKPVFIPSPIRTWPLVHYLKLAEEGAES